MNEVVVEVVVKPVITTLVTLTTMALVGVGLEMVDRECYKRQHRHHKHHEMPSEVEA